jgi:hypothetical protein
MNRAHHCSDETFDMSSHIRLPRWSMLNGDAIFLAATHQCLGMELFGIIDMDEAWQSSHGPVEVVEFPVSEPWGLGQDAMRECQRDR